MKNKHRDTTHNHARETDTQTGCTLDTHTLTYTTHLQFVVQMGLKP